jgi:uncharacterized protein YoxC
MIGEIALCVGAVAFAVLVGALIPLLIQLRKSVEESERLLAVSTSSCRWFRKCARSRRG